MSGYREEVELEGSGKLEPESSGDPTRVMLLGGAILLGLFFLLEVLSWLTEGGGVFSIVSALLSVHGKPPILSIDENALRFPIIVILWLMIVGLCRLFDIQLDPSSRGKMLLPLLIIIGGGFIVDGEFGEPLITRYMAGHGYSRCHSGDWTQGSGKSQVWFANYVLMSTDCHQHQP